MRARAQKNVGVAAKLHANKTQRPERCDCSWLSCLAILRRLHHTVTGRTKFTTSGAHDVIAITSPPREE